MTSPQHHSLSSLVDAATPLLLLITQLRHMDNLQNVNTLRDKVGNDIKQFQQRLTEHHYPQTTIETARYCICTALDEVVMKHAWSMNSVWTQQSLLSQFDHETWGGERIYHILEELEKNVTDNLELLELNYLLLSLGFEGKYYAEEADKAELIRKRLFVHINKHRCCPDEAISLHCCNHVPQEESNNNKVQRLLIASGLITLACALLFNTLAYQAAKTSLQKLNQIATNSAAAAFMQATNHTNRRQSTHEYLDETN